jgi:tetratricopeptide (TPR) repeat protein
VKNVEKPDTAESYFDKGISFIGKGKHDAAISEFTESINRNIKYVHAYIYRGVAHYMKKDYDAAIADYTKAISIDPNFPLIYTNRGLV